MAQPTPALLVAEPSTAISNVIVHPLVLLHILDHHSRRQEEGGRVIGTLLGRRDGATVEITSSFAVPHAEEGDEVAIGKDFNRSMLALHLRTNRKEVVVGWYATAAEKGPMIRDTSSLIHDFYTAETEDGEPVHIVADTRLQEDNLSLRAYKNSTLQLQGETLGNLFHELRLSLRSNEPEAICLSEMIKKSGPEKTESVGEAKDALQMSMEALHTKLEKALKYVNDVVDGKVPPDAEKGRKLADTLAAVPRIKPEVLDGIFHDSLQDLLMVNYLSNITKTQVTLAEKLNASLAVSRD